MELEEKIETRELEENLLHSCRSLLYYLGQYVKPTRDGVDEKKVEIYNLLLKDLVWRISRIDGPDKLEILLKSWFYIAQSEIQNTFPLDTLGLSNYDNLINRKLKTDVAIITARGDELKSVLFALGHPGLDHRDAFSSLLRLPLYKTNLTGNRGNQLSLLITMAGEERNISSAMAVMDLLNDYNIDLFVMIGIAAGRKDKVKRGDVIFPYQVYDYEGGRLVPEKTPLTIESSLGYREETVHKPRPQLPRIKKEVITAWELFYPSAEHQFIEYSKELKKKCNASDLPPDIRTRNYKPAIHSGDVTVGEKLIKDGQYINVLTDYNENIIGLNEEDYGFSKTASDVGAKWCIFRGVSDFGDPGSNKEWHFISTLNAAAACITFLKTVWPPELP